MVSAGHRRVRVFTFPCRPRRSTTCFRKREPGVGLAEYWGEREAQAAAQRAGNLTRRWRRRRLVAWRRWRVIGPFMVWLF